MEKFRDLLKTTIGSKVHVAFSLLSLGLLVVAFFGEETLIKMKALNQDGYESVKSMWASLPRFLEKPVGKIVCCTLFIVILFAWCIRLFYRRRVILLKQSTMGKDIRIDKAFNEKCWCKNLDVILFGITATELVAALSEQDLLSTKYSKIISKGRKPKPLYYCGIAHTPFVFRLGYQLSGKTDIKFLHEFRDGKKDSYFSVLKEHDEDRMPLNSLAGSKESDSTELLVGIGVTYPIKAEELDQIDVNCQMNRYHFTIDSQMKGVDFFNSYHKIASLAASIVDNIEVICKERNIARAHIAISASTPFTFFLAQRLKSNQIPDIIVYHYENSSYPWGIRIKETDPQNAIVLVREQNYIHT